MSRYARQMILPEVGAAGQALLARSHVMVVGAGGLGCPVLQYLVGAGVGRITLYDPDHVEESNLHRQPLYRMADLGRPKAEAAAQTLRGFNPDVAIEARVAAMGPGPAPGVAQAADLVIDAADSFAVSYILSDACFAAGTPLISASVLGQAGYVGGFCGGAPSLRAVFPDLPGSGATCATAGVLGPAVGVIGSLQAQLALRALLGSEPSPLGRMVSLDLAGLRFGGFGFHGAPEPEVAWSFVRPAMCAPTDRIVDLRGVAEAPVLLHPAARRVDPGDLEQELAPGRRLVLCCASGLRAWRAAEGLRAKGHDRIALMAASACA